MCDDCVVASAEGVSRRELLAAGAGLAAAALAGGGAACADERPPRTLPCAHLQDLTHTLRPDFPTFSGARALAADVVARVASEGYYGLRLAYWEHVGTHMDAPAHFSEEAATLERIAPETLLAPAAVIDIRERAAKDHDARVLPDDVLAWEKRHGRLPDGALVLMLSGWAARVDEPGAFRNADASGTMHFPGFSAEAARMLLDERSVVGIGTDTISLDHGASRTYDVHKLWLPAGRWGLENVAALDRIPPAGAHVFVGAPKILRSSGGPCRLLAVW